MDWNGGEEVFVDHVEIGPTRFTYVGKYPDTASSLAPLVFFRMKDGQILTRKQMGLELEMRDIPGPANVFGKELAEIVYTSRSVMDLTEIASVILGTAEFSLNGEPLGEVQMRNSCIPFPSRWERAVQSTRAPMPQAWKSCARNWELNISGMK